MALDLWFKSDVGRILQAAHECMTMTADLALTEMPTGFEFEAGRLAGYRQGYEAALRVVATAFGLTEQPGVTVYPVSRERWLTTSQG